MPKDSIEGSITYRGRFAGLLLTVPILPSQRSNRNLFNLNVGYHNKITCAHHRSWRNNKPKPLWNEEQISLAEPRAKDFCGTTNPVKQRTKSLLNQERITPPSRSPLEQRLKYNYETKSRSRADTPVEHRDKDLCGKKSRSSCKTMSRNFRGRMSKRLRSK